MDHADGVGDGFGWKENTQECAENLGTDKPICIFKLRGIGTNLLSFVFSYIHLESVHIQI